MHSQLVQIIRRNCDLSDGRDSGIYPLCTLVLKLRTLYKWEHGLEPWEEPETPVVLDWIEAKENFWATLTGEEFQPLPLDGTTFDPFAVEEINGELAGSGLVYGAGYGRSLKAIFFLAELLEERRESDCRILILGREEARELAAPFAMRQGEEIIIRREPLRFFLWDQFQEIQAGRREPLRRGLAVSGVRVEPEIDREDLKEKLDAIVNREIPAFIHHEIGELRSTELTSDHLQRLVAAFPASNVELTARAVKDALADTHPDGMLGYIIRTRAESSLAFYAGFLSGMRQALEPEIAPAFRNFLQDGQWLLMEEARHRCREANLRRAEILRQAAEDLERDGAEGIKCRIEREILVPLGL